MQKTEALFREFALLFLPVISQNLCQNLHTERIGKSGIVKGSLHTFQLFLRLNPFFFQL